MRYLIVDGMYGGTGVRDAIEGGYVDLIELHIPIDLQDAIRSWLQQYEEAHYFQFKDQDEVIRLDKQGIDICRQLRIERFEDKIDYFSNATMKKIQVD
jgi:hypothetical protein